jgi:hypothetical protein
VVGSGDNEGELPTDVHIDTVDGSGQPVPEINGLDLSLPDSFAKPLGVRVLALSQPEVRTTWVRRRIERIRVVDEQTVDRESTLIIDLSEIPVSELPYDPISQTLVLPVDRLERGEHMVTDVEAIGCDSCTVPTRSYERDLVVEDFHSRWETTLPAPTLKMMARTLREKPDRLPLLARVIVVLVGMIKSFRAKRSRRVPLVSRLRTAGGWRALSESWQKLSKSPRTKAQDCADNAVENLPEGVELSDIQIGTLLVELEDWQRNALLLVELGRESLRDHRRLMIVLQSSETIPTLTVFGQHPFRAAFARLRKLMGGSLSSALQFSALRAVGTARSTHIMVEVPEGFRAVDGRLRVEYEPSDDKIVEVVYRDFHRLPSVSHIHMEAEESTLVRDATFIVSFYAYRTGFFYESLIASWILWGIIQVFYDRVASVNFAYPKAHFDDPLAAALILLVPAALVTLITQRDSHRTASGCYALPRFLLAVDAIATTAAASTLALGRVELHISTKVWQAALLTTQIVAARLTLGALVHEFRVSRGRSWLFRPYWAIYDMQQMRELKEEVLAVKAATKEAA